MGSLVRPMKQWDAAMPRQPWDSREGATLDVNPPTLTFQLIFDEVVEVRQRLEGPRIAIVGYFTVVETADLEERRALVYGPRVAPGMNEVTTDEAVQELSQPVALAPESRGEVARFCIGRLAELQSAVERVLGIEALGEER